MDEGGKEYRWYSYCRSRDHGSGHPLLQVTVTKSSHGRGCVHCVPAGIPGADIVLPGEVAGCERAGSVTR